MKQKNFNHRKKLYFITILIFMAVCILYFRPMRLSLLLEEGKEIQIVENEFGIENGEPYIDTKTYDNLTDRQQQDIITLLQKCKYRRNLRTIVSDGTMWDMGDVVVRICLWGEGKATSFVSISDSGLLSDGKRTYVIANASEFIRELLQAVRD